jgi:ABC-type multidrug transport system ATPase subunit
MIEIKDLTLTLRGDGRELVKDFSFTLHPGDRAVLIGEEGNGKSTLLQYLADPALVEPYCEAAGRVLCRGRTAYLPQLPPPALAHTPVAELFDGLEWYEHTDTLASLGLPVELLASQRPFGSFSGGEKVKLQLAALLMTDPDVLLLDEPTNDLDIATLRWMERFLVALRLPVLYISHDETLIERTANVILHMEQLIRKTRCRMTVTRAPYREYLARRAQGFDKQAQVAQKQRDDYDKQLARWRQIHDKVEHQQNSIGLFELGTPPQHGRIKEIFYQFALFILLISCHRGKPDTAPGVLTVQKCAQGVIIRRQIIPRTKGDSQRPCRLSHDLIRKGESLFVRHRGVQRAKKKIVGDRHHCTSQREQIHSDGLFRKFPAARPLKEERGVEQKKGRQFQFGNDTLDHRHRP